MRARADAWETVEKTLLQRADDAEATTGALRQERAQLDVRVRELTKRNESLQVEREVARTTVTDLKMQVDKLSERVDSIANERDMKESRIQSLTRQLGQSKSELAERDLRLKEEVDTFVLVTALSKSTMFRSRKQTTFPSVSKLNLPICILHTPNWKRHTRRSRRNPSDG